MRCYKCDEPKKIEVRDFPPVSTCTFLHYTIVSMLIALVYSLVVVRPSHRSQLQRLLAKNLRSPDEVLHFSKRLASYVEPADHTQPILLCFKDGSEATCDLLVGSDGIHSAVRRTMYTELATETSDVVKAREMMEMIDPVWSGVVVYRGLVPVDKVSAETLAGETRGVAAVSILALSVKELLNNPIFALQLLGKNQVTPTLVPLYCCHF